MNTAIFAGNVGADATLNSVNGQNGATSVLNFSLAVSKRQKGADGKPLTLWVACSVWGQRADALAPFIKKGTKLTVSGEIDVETYIAKDQTSQAKMICRVNELTLQGSPTDQPAAQGGYQPQARPQGQPQPAQQPYNQQAPIGYNPGGSAAPNNHGFTPNHPQGMPNQPPINFDDDIPF